MNNTWNRSTSTSRFDDTTINNSNRPCLDDSLCYKSFSPPLCSTRNSGNQTSRSPPGCAVPICSCPFGEENSLCILEKSVADANKCYIDGPLVWKTMKPPSLSGSPLVTARQIDILRAKMTGKIGEQSISTTAAVFPPSNLKKEEALTTLSNRCAL